MSEPSAEQWPAAEGVRVVEALERMLAELARAPGGVARKASVEAGAEPHTWSCRLGGQTRTFRGDDSDESLRAAIEAWAREVAGAG